LRQLHYAIFSKAEIDYENDRASYRKLSAVTSMSRRLNRNIELYRVSWASILGAHKVNFPAYGLSRDETRCAVQLHNQTIPHDWVVDETRQPHMVNVFEDAAQYVEAVKRSYRRDNWQTQPHYVEVWSEKGTVLGSIRPVADELGITVRVAHGFASAGMEGQVGNLFEDIDKEITVFYIGDHDPSGHVIEQDIHRRAQIACGKEFDMIRLAIHADDIKRFKLPPQRIKESDSRSRGFKQRFGARAATVELDALPVNELRRRVRDSVIELIDRDLWNQQLSTEKAEFTSIQNFAATLKNLPQLQRPQGLRGQPRGV
jgi:hypothetical protein